MPDDLDFDNPRPPTEEEWGRPLVEPRSAPDIETQFRRRVGMVSGAVPYVTPHPWLYRPFLFLSDPALAHIDEDYASALSFIIARDNSCRFCYSTFRTLLRLSNFSPQDLDDLESHFSAQGFSRGEEWGLRLAVRLSRCRGVSEAFDRLRACGYADRAIREMAGISVLNLAANRIGTMLSIPVSTFEGMADEWYLRPWRRLARPLLRFTKHWTNGAAPVADEGGTGFLGAWTGTLRGTTVGRVLQRIAKQWLSSTQSLTVETKLLMLGVVARGVGADRLEEHLQTRLQEQHGFSTDAVHAALDHLGGAAVSDQVESLLRLARASIRYDFGPIKRVAWECTKGFDRSGTLEAIATVSLANALARLETLHRLDETNAD